MGTGSGKLRDNAPSLDRIDPRGGYTKDNVIIVSFKANRIKSNASVSEILMVGRFYERLAAERAGLSNVPGVQSKSEKEEG